MVTVGDGKKQMEKDIEADPWALVDDTTIRTPWKGNYRIN